jgi:hypothetical protein
VSLNFRFAIPVLYDFYLLCPLGSDKRSDKKGESL